MDRFSADYIRQQPEYRYLIHKDTSQVIQTCVEDGEVKLRFGRHPTRPVVSSVKLPQRVSRPSSTSGDSNAVPRPVASDLTTGQFDQSNTLQRSIRNREIQKERHAGGVACESTNTINGDVNKQKQADDTERIPTETIGTNLKGHKESTDSDRLVRNTENKNICQRKQTEATRDTKNKDVPELESEARDGTSRSTEASKNKDLGGHRNPKIPNSAVQSKDNVSKHADSIVLHLQAVTAVPDLTVDEASHSESPASKTDYIDRGVCTTPENTVTSALTPTGEERGGETHKKQPVFQEGNKTKTTDVQGKQSGMPKSADKPQASKRSSTARNKQVHRNTQMHHKTSTSVTGRGNPSCVLSKETRDERKDTENALKGRQISSAADPEMLGRNQRFSSLSIHTPHQPAKSQSGDVHSKQREYQGDKDHLFKKHGNENRKELGVHINNHPEGNLLQRKATYNPSVDAAALMSKTHLTSSQQAPESMDTPNQSAEADQRTSEKGTLRGDTPCSTANNHTLHTQVKTGRIDGTGSDQSLMAPKACNGGDNYHADSDCNPAYPRPVTRVDVIELQSSGNSAIINIIHCDQLQGAKYGCKGRNELSENTVATSSFAVPDIIVDEASTEDNVSEYSHDDDAVAIDADEYLVQADKQNTAGLINLLALPVQQHFLNRPTNRVQLNSHENTKPSLRVPQDPQLSEEGMPSRWQEESGKLSIESTFSRRHSIAAALELAGLKRTLTPSTYNVEFQPHTILRPHSLQDSAFMLQTPRDSVSSLVPLSATRSRHSSLKSALSSRRSSTASVRPVRWDLGESDTSTMSRQVSWDTAVTGRFIKRRNSSAHVHHSGTSSQTMRHLQDWRTAADFRSFEEVQDGDTVPVDRHRRDSGQNSSTYSEATRRMSTASGLTEGRIRRASRVDGMLEEDMEADQHLLRQASQVQYDPVVEKSQSFNHPRGNSFTKASQYLTPVRSGLRNLQVHYSKTNTTHNDGLIFAHLLRAAHVRNAAVEDGVYTLERRLYTRRHGQTPHATTFYDVQKSGRKTSNSSKVYSTAAKKKKERRERIKRKNKELEMGYTPRALSLKELGPDDIEAVRNQCRYLRVSPTIQQHLYTTDTELWDTVTSPTS